MPKKKTGRELAIREDYGIALQTFETGLTTFIENQGLPADRVFVGLPERARVFQNVDAALSLLSPEQLQNSVYIAKFIAAAGSGLFDAALNYLWDETICELRKRVSQYDIAYFYDIAVRSPDRRKTLKTPDDLDKISDQELVQGANLIGLISDIGLQHLDYIRYMRNYASAAHPNQNELTGLQLVSWLETCIKEVINLPQENVVVEIRKLLSNIKENEITEAEAHRIAVFFTELTADRVDTLASGFFGIFVDQSADEQTRENIRLLLPELWPRVSSDTRNGFGLRYARYVANNDADQQDWAREFLDLVDGAEYLPDSIRVAEIDSAIQDLLSAHRGTNNFYTEPGAARQLKTAAGSSDAVPDSIRTRYVLCLVEVYLSNGNGVAWNAEPTYDDLIRGFTPEMAMLALISFSNKNIASSLQFRLCKEKWQQLLELITPKIRNATAKELLAAIEASHATLENLSKDSTLMTKVQNLRKILGI